MNLAWLAVPLTFVSGLAVGYSTRRGSSNETVSADAYSDTVLLFCVAAIVEAAAEPAWLYAQANGLIPTRVTAEGGALLLRALATGLLVLREMEAATERPWRLAGRSSPMPPLIYSCFAYCSIGGRAVKYSAR